MKKVFKWLGISLGSLVGLILLAGLGLALSTDIRMKKTYAVQVETISVPTDPASVERGRLWVSSQCTHCHGPDMAGAALLNDPAIGVVSALNLTPGEGGAGSEFADEDWVRAIRHGISPEGTSLLIMPSSDFYYFSDRDLGDIIAYLKSLPPVDNAWSDPEFTPFAKVLVGAGAFGKIFEAENIDHGAARPVTPDAGATVEYGTYLVTVSGCHNCHGEDLAGEMNPPNPSSPPVPGIGPGSEVAYWSEAQFIATIRTGVAPSGHVLNEIMPWKNFNTMTDEQLGAIWLYLKSQTTEQAAAIPQK